MSAAGVRAARRREAAIGAPGGLRSHRARRHLPGDRGRAAEPAPSLFDGLGGEPTLDHVLAGAWEGLAAHSVVPCPVCGDEMAPEYGSHALPVGGRCGGCDTTLA
jgi:hypothetical protein